MAESPSTPAPELAPYNQPAFRLTISLDVAAGNATVAAMRVMEICRELANLTVNPLNGKALHDQLVGVVLNVVCFNDPTPVDTPLDPAELTRLQDAVAAMQAGGGLEALAGLLQPQQPAAEQNGGGG